MIAMYILLLGSDQVIAIVAGSEMQELDLEIPLTRNGKIAIYLRQLVEMRLTFPLWHEIFVGLCYNG